MAWTFTENREWLLVNKVASDKIRFGLDYFFIFFIFSKTIMHVPIIWIKYETTLKQTKSVTP